MEAAIGCDSGHSCRFSRSRAMLTTDDYCERNSAYEYAAAAHKRHDAPSVNPADGVGLHSSNASRAVGRRLQALFWGDTLERGPPPRGDTQSLCLQSHCTTAQCCLEAHPLGCRNSRLTL